MQVSRTLAIATAAILGLSSLAHAESTLTRAQVKAEAFEAIRSGDVLDYETGRKLNELFPLAYPRTVKAPTLPAATQPTSAKSEQIGDVEYDAIAQRNAQAVARHTAASQQQLAGVTR